MQFTGIQRRGRVYLMPPAPYAATVRRRRRSTPRPRVDGEWLVADLRISARMVRGLELRTHGNLRPAATDLRVETSPDGVNWTAGLRTSGPEDWRCVGALDLPRVIPLRVDLQDVTARYVRRQRAGFVPRAVHLRG